jgi:hypothetical protein
MSEEITNYGDFIKQIDRLRELQRINDINRYRWKNENNDMVNHPQHYKGIYGLEVIEVMRNFISKYQNAYVGAMICNVLKYILRAPSKGKQLEDLKKARKHLDFAIEELEKLNEVQQETKA